MRRQFQIYIKFTSMDGNVHWRPLENTCTVLADAWVGYAFRERVDAPDAASADTTELATDTRS